ncbi:MAG: hypothetical protein BWK79_10600 [Beggiatoa sp. IS2]|nr:MAG: hypothetical protein BWK79_10600 [Beggiatoa sp. IS2]
MASQLRSEITARIQERVRNYLETAHLINHLNANDIELGQLDLENIPTLELYFWKQIQTFPQVTNTFIGLPNGKFVGAGGQGQGFPQILLSDESTDGSLSYYNTNAQGKRLSIVVSAKDYDPTKRDWYKDAIKAGKPIWGNIYREFATKQLAISAAQAVYSTEGQLLGVLGSTALFSSVNEFLSKLKIGESGKTFIMERSGELVASSTKSPVFKKSSEVKGEEAKDDKAERVMASESENEVIKLTTQHLESHFGSLQNITDSQQIDFKIGGARQFIQVAPLTLGDKKEGGLDFLVVVTIPEADFMGRITANTNVSMAMSLFALVLTVLIGLLTARWIIQPILTLNKATKSFAAGNWDQKLPIERSDELGELAKSFNSMGKQVKKSFLDLEEANATLEQKVKERTQELSVALEELKASQAQLVQSEKMASLGQMVAGVAHEINTPLGYIKSNVEMTKDLFDETENLVAIYDSLIHLLMSEDVGEEELNSQLAVVTELSSEFRENETFHETKELFKDVIYGLDQISELVVNLKDFSRLDQARVTDINLNECLDSVLIIGHNVIGNKIEIEKQYGELPLVQCSPSHINQVFLNIVTNAAQAMDKAGTIYLRTRADNENVYVEIEDTGKGIPEDVIAKIFDPFFTTKPIGEGTGLGLSICYQIIEQHNGEIKVASEVGKGTTFKISLPRQAPSSL